MPEGDTIFRSAARLRSVLQGHPIRAAESRDPALRAESLKDRLVTVVEARGKHLLMHLDDGRVIHSHMGMHGAWHVYQPEQPWHKPARQAALCLQVPDAVCVCFNPKTLELLSEAGFRRHPYLSRLGPDLLAEALDDDEILRRFRVHNARPIGEAVMDQTIVCGIGNVYKSEVLFLCRIDPFLAVQQLSDDQLRSLIQRARQLMSRNLQGYPRRTRFGLDGGRVWVYGRGGEPCLVCGTPIRIRRQGDLGRTTYWCPACQACNV